MKPFAQMPDAIRDGIRYVLTDIDDTLTTEGRLPAAAFAAMERLRNHGIPVIPITGRPAGWCDHIARMWPVEGLVGENGAFYFRYDESRKKMVRRFWKSNEERRDDRLKLESLQTQILKTVPGCALSADQAYREADLAIDYCEDVAPLSQKGVDEIVRLFEAVGACAKVSSIHVNGWFGDYDKLAMTRRMFAEVFDTELEDVRDQVIYTGDSPNDVPMFAFFPNAVGVANVIAFKDRMATLPAWVTTQKGGYGFAEMVAGLLHKNPTD